MSIVTNNGNRRKERRCKPPTSPLPATNHLRHPRALSSQYASSPGAMLRSVDALRNLIHKADTRHSTRGDVSGNGLAEAGAIIRVGRKVLIDEARFFDWIDAQTEGARKGDGWPSCLTPLSQMKKPPWPAAFSGHSFNAPAFYYPKPASVRENSWRPAPRHDRLTQLDALHRFGNFRLAADVEVLRRHGWPIPH